MSTHALIAYVLLNVGVSLLVGVAAYEWRSAQAKIRGAFKLIDDMQAARDVTGRIVGGSRRW